MKKETKLKALQYFGLSAAGCTLQPLGKGHVNESTLVHCEDGSHYTLQRLNAAAFADGEGIMHNVLAVTGHLDRMGVRTLHFLQGSDGPIYNAPDGGQYRISRYITRCSVRDSISCDAAQEVGAAFGALHMALSSLPLGSLRPLHEGHFHNMRRYRDALSAARPLAQGENAALCDAILQAMQQDIAAAAMRRQLPERVVHGDPKLHNLLFSDDTGLPVCFIDFDNAGIGYLTDDFGDAARSACCADGGFSAEHFTRFARGFLATAPFVSDAEREALPEAPARVALELSARYLTDALTDSGYFGSLRNEQKLAFAKARFALYEDAMHKLPQLKAACGI